MRPSRSKLGFLACTACLFATAAAAQQSMLPPGVQPVSPKEGRTVTDPEQLSQRTPAHLVQDLHAAFGAHQARAVHTKGTILQGWFDPAPGGTALSSATLFRARVPVIVRFSDFTGIPDIPDTDKNAQPRGLAVKFLLPDGSNLDLVNHSFNGFPVSTAWEFGELLRAIGASGPDAAKPTSLDRFLASHPIAKQFLTTQTPPPASWATTAYFGVNAYQFTPVAGPSHYVRYRFVPEAGEHYLTDAELAQRGPNYLGEEIAGRVAKRPIRFTWYAQIAQAGDIIDNPAIAWPETRRLVKLGTITVDRLGPNTPLADRSLLFLPGTMTPGIAVADPMLSIRNAAYPVSFKERP
jgi:catalase